MNVLITGAGGFIGSHLVDSQLEKGHQVRGVDLELSRLGHVEGHPCLEAVRGDITDPALVRTLVAGVDVVYHLASAHLDVRQSEDHYRLVNVDATLSLLEAARQAGVRRFVHCSSVGVMGNIQHPPADETAPCRPENIYGRTKLEGETAALEFARQTGFPVVVIRPAWVYGARCPRTAKLMRTLKKGRFPIFGSGKTWRHPVYISDAIAGLELAAEAENADGEVFLIAGEAPMPVQEMLAVMSATLGVRPPKLRLPLGLGVLAGAALEAVFKILGKQPPFSRRSLEFFLSDNAYDIRKARQMLGYHPQVDLRAGMQQTIAWDRTAARK
jgi:nucleoside-diphosphate-sugar epimerase